MATEFFFNGRLIKQPGAYATIVAGQRNAPLNLDYGRVLVIDTGGGALYGGGAGINGEFANGKDAVYRFNNIEDYQFFLKGGPLWPVANGLFRPDVTTAAVGSSEILHVRAATTEAARMSFTGTGGGDDGGTFTFQVRDEGRIGNGELNETRATSSLTITNAGAGGDTISISENNITIASYTVEASDAIADVRDGLIANLNERQVSSVTSTSATGFTFQATANRGATPNGTPPVVSTVGTVVATAGNFAGGVTGDELAKGYAFQFRTGIVDNTKWIFDVYVGTFTGNHTDNIAYNGISDDIAEPRLLASSPEFNNIQTLIEWGRTDAQFGNFFVFDESGSSFDGTGMIDAADIANFPNYNFATGGTETYNTLRIDEVLAAVQDELFSFIITDIHGANVNTNSDVLKIVNWIRNTSKYERQFFIGANDTEPQFSQSVAIATGFDRDFVVAVHGEVGFASQDVASGFRIFDSLVHTAYVLGRTAGRPPQVPVTNKTLGIDMLSHNPTSRQKDQALDAGLLLSFFNPFLNRIVVLQGVNTLQDNKVLFNNQGQSHQISFKRIVAQINMELIVNAETQLLADEGGVNANTLSPGMIKNFVETYLESRLAVPDLDNLLLNYRDVVVTRQADAYFVNYAIVVNNEINKLFFTGFLFS